MKVSISAFSIPTEGAPLMYNLWHSDKKNQWSRITLLLLTWSGLVEFHMDSELDSST